ncbi:GtrA family protein [Clostridium sp. 'White wine YQ']|uniref:GtrA family protein n=1 Tax=Clostridium sp. 'White wine YQ' TaxID=3027474 RepID=UPI002366AA57|nr:GtrA family protein [Clostridium sp. 'White wine YQ']MDD7792967.1 GtrA family protein [Clostridium sp. 'White wine YQ']
MINKSFNYKSIIQFITYALVGASNVIIDLIVLNILWFASGMYIGRINYLFKLISFAVYSTTGYLLNRKYTFKTKASIKSYFSYISLLAVLSLMDAIILVKLTRLNPFHLHRGLNANLSAFTAAMATGLIGFIINKFIIFRKKSHNEHPNEIGELH